MTIAAWSVPLGIIGIVALIGSVVSFLFTLNATYDAGHHGWRQRRPTLDPDHPSWDGLHAVTTYHRRYVWPARDLDAGSQRVWARAIGAANKIRESEAVRFIDSVEITTVLPYRLWEIAERLARLSTLRTEHDAILLGVEADDPDVEMASRASVDVQAIVDQADDAVRQANEAGRSLALPRRPS